MPAPEPDNIEFLRDWLNLRNFLRGSELWTWQPRPNESRFFEQDLLTFQSASDEQDAFSKRLSSSLLHLWNTLGTRRSSSASSWDAKFHKAIDDDDEIIHYSQKGLLKFENILISVIGAAMPIVSIVALYFIKTEGGRPHRCDGWIHDSVRVCPCYVHECEKTGDSSVDSCFCCSGSGVHREQPGKFCITSEMDDIWVLGR